MKPSVKQETNHVEGLTLLNASIEQIYLIMSFLNPACEIAQQRSRTCVRGSISLKSVCNSGDGVLSRFASAWLSLACVAPYDAINEPGQHF